MRKRSISGKTVSLYGKSCEIPNIKKQKGSYSKRFKVNNLTKRNLDLHSIRSNENNKKRVSKKSKKSKRNTANNPFELNIFPQNSVDSITYAESFFKRNKVKKSRPKDKSVDKVLKKSKRKNKNSKYLTYTDC